MDPKVQRIRRLVIAEAPRFPDLATAYWDHGFHRVIGTVAEHFQSLAEAGGLQAPDPLAAAQHFAGLLLWVPSNRTMFSGRPDVVTGVELEGYARAGASAFLRAYPARRAAVLSSAMTTSRSLVANPLASPPLSLAPHPSPHPPPPVSSVSSPYFPRPGSEKGDRSRVLQPICRRENRVSCPTRLRIASPCNTHRPLLGRIPVAHCGRSRARTLGARWPSRKVQVRWDQPDQSRAVIMHLPQEARPGERSVVSTGSTTELGLGRRCSADLLLVWSKREVQTRRTRQTKTGLSNGTVRRPPRQPDPHRSGLSAVAGRHFRRHPRCRRPPDFEPYRLRRAWRGEVHGVGGVRAVVAEGYIEGRAGGGSVVAALTSLRPRTRTQTSALAPTPRAAAIVPYDRRPDATATFDLRPGRVDESLFPAAAWRRCVLRALDRTNGQYGDPAGTEELRATLAHWVARSRAVVAKDSQSGHLGSRARIDLIARVLVEPVRLSRSRSPATRRWSSCSPPTAPRSWDVPVDAPA